MKLKCQSRIIIFSILLNFLAIWPFISISSSAINPFQNVNLDLNSSGFRAVSQAGGNEHCIPIPDDWILPRKYIINLANLKSPFNSNEEKNEEENDQCLFPIFLLAFLEGDPNNAIGISTPVYFEDFQESNPDIITASNVELFLDLSSFSDSCVVGQKYFTISIIVSMYFLSTTNDFLPYPENCELLQAPTIEPNSSSLFQQLAICCKDKKESDVILALVAPVNTYQNLSSLDLFKRTFFRPEIKGQDLHLNLRQKNHKEALNPAQVNIKSYPNPISDFLHICFDNTNQSKISIKVFDINGLHLKKYNKTLSVFDKDIITIDFSSLPKGLFFLILQLNEKTEAIKITKM